MKIRSLLFILVIVFCASLFARYLFLPHSVFRNVDISVLPKLLSTPLSSKKLTTIVFTGDVMLGRTVEIAAREHKDFTYPFGKVALELQKADLTFVNLENPIVDGCKPFISGFVFCANPEMLAGLTFAGVDIVTLANNHSHNYGEKGIEETKKALNARGIEYTGLNNLVIKQYNNITFGFLGFDKAQQITPKLTQEEAKFIEDSDKKVDVLIVAMHWGVEYQDKALPGIRKLAQELVKRGADVVIGSHPHWVQDYENIDGLDGIKRPVYYSLGNFVFDQMWSEPTRRGLVVKITFDGKNIVKEELLPVYIKERGQPEFN